MSRYYDILLTAPTGSATKTWTSFPNNAYNPNALNVELDLFVSGASASGEIGSSTVTIEGIALADLQQAKDYGPSMNSPGWNIAIKGGMQPGLPLATLQSHPGLLLQGSIFQSFANWVGTEMTLNFVVVASGYTLDHPGNFTFTWQQGQSLAQALTNTLSIAYPYYTLSMSIGNQYTPPGGQTAAMHYKTLGQLARYIQNVTAQTNPPYGVNISLYGTTISAADGSQPTHPIQLLFTDLIGQPKWVAPDTMQFVTAMRSDIQVNSYVLMPPQLENIPGLLTTSPATQTNIPGALKNQSTFQGAFQITGDNGGIRHVGNFRDPNGASWASIFQAVVAAQ